MNRIVTWMILGVVAALSTGCGEQVAAPGSQGRPTPIFDKPPAGFVIEGAAPGGHCNFDTINGISRDTPDITIKGGSELKLSAWAAYAIDEGVLPDKVLLSITAGDGHRWFVEFAPDKRTDVATYFKSPKLVDAGLVANSATIGVKPGPALMQIYMTKGAATYLCQVAKQVRVQ
jgi:hypothetical protein